MKWQSRNTVRLVPNNKTNGILSFLEEVLARIKSTWWRLKSLRTPILLSSNLKNLPDGVLITIIILPWIRHVLWSMSTMIMFLLTKIHSKSLQIWSRIKSRAIKRNQLFSWLIWLDSILSIISRISTESSLKVWNYCLLPPFHLWRRLQ